MNKEFDFLVFIGRFQPFHIGHFAVLKLALQKSQKVIVVVGSANRPRSPKNPLTFNERSDIISSLLSIEETKRVSIVSANDYTYNDIRWQSESQDAGAKIVAFPWVDKTPRIGIIGHQKDNSSYYLKMFPQWEPVEVSKHYVINASDIRESVYDNMTDWEPAWFVNDDHEARVIAYLGLIINREMSVIHEEYHMLKKYKQSWATAPFPPTFVTVDSVVVQSGHILLVKRKSAPGEGLYALPGGFLGQDEKLEDAALRELIEETQIGVRYPKLKGSIVASHVFDAPNRSQRGRTITHAFYIKLPDDLKLPTVVGSDDAAKAEWIPISQLASLTTEMFEDHADIIEYFVNV